MMKSTLLTTGLHHSGWLNKPIWLALVIVFGMGKPALAQTDPPPEAKRTTMQSKQLDVQYPVKLNYLLALPEGYEQGEAWPLVLFLHGAGERGDDLNRVKVHGPPKQIAAGKSFPFILVAPQCPSDQWWEPISLTALLDEVERNYKVDPTRIYVTGLSMGGFGTWALAAHTPKRFAAIAPICGGGDVFSVSRRIGNSVPAWVFHGARDNVVPLSRSVDMVEAFAGYQAPIKLTVDPEAGHDSWTAAYDDPEFYQWMLAQKRSVK